MNFKYPKIFCVLSQKNDHLTVIFSKQVLNRSSEGILKKYTISLAHQRGEFGGLEISSPQEIKYHPEYN